MAILICSLLKNKRKIIIQNIFNKINIREDISSLLSSPKLFVFKNALSYNLMNEDLCNIYEKNSISNIYVHSTEDNRENRDLSELKEFRFEEFYRFDSLKIVKKVLILVLLSFGPSIL